MTSFRMTPEQAKKLSTTEQYEWFRRATSRRNLLRGGIAGAGALAAGTVLGGTANAATTARSAGPTLLSRTGPSAGVTTAPFGQHVAFGPNPSDSIAVGWQVRDAVSKPYLRIAEAPRPPLSRSAACSPPSTCTRATSPTPRTAATAC
jgi:hypothetical protein